MKSFQSRGMIAKEALLDMIASKIAQNQKEGSNRLPSEEELAKTLGISIATVREVLRTVEREGYISKRHGMGNFYHTSTFQAHMRIDVIKNFSELLQAAGYTVSVTQTQLCAYTEKHPTEFEQAMQEKHGALYWYDRLYYANDSVAIITRNYIPKSLFVDSEPTAEEEMNIIDFLWARCKQQVTHSIESMEADLATQREATLFHLDPNTPLFRWFETLYTYSDFPIGYAEVIFHPRIVHMRLVRKWM